MPTTENTCLFSLHWLAKGSYLCSQISSFPHWTVKNTAPSLGNGCPSLSCPPPQPSIALKLSTTIRKPQGATKLRRGKKRFPHPPVGKTKVEDGERWEREGAKAVRGGVGGGWDQQYLLCFQGGRSRHIFNNNKYTKTDLPALLWLLGKGGGGEPMQLQQRPISSPPLPSPIRQIPHCSGLPSPSNCSPPQPTLPTVPSHSSPALSLPLAPHTSLSFRLWSSFTTASSQRGKPEHPHLRPAPLPFLRPFTS